MMPWLWDLLSTTWVGTRVFLVVPWKGSTMLTVTGEQSRISAPGKLREGIMSHGQPGLHSEFQVVYEADFTQGITSEGRLGERNTLKSLSVNIRLPR